MPTFRHFCFSVYERWSDTVTGRRSASFVILAAIVGVANIIFAANLDKDIWLKILVGAGLPFLFFFVAFIIAVFLIWRDEHRKVIDLTQKLTPMLTLDFDQNGDGIVLTPIKVYQIDAGHQTIIDSNGSYVRIRLSAISDSTVRGCSAFLTRVEKRDASGNFVAVRMPNSLRLTTTPVDVPQRVPQTIDFLSSGERENKLSIVGAIPLMLVDVLEDITSYRFSIIIIPQESADQSITVEINWAGKWITISGRKI